MASRGVEDGECKSPILLALLEGISLHNKRARCFLESAWIGATLFVAVGDSAARQIVWRHLDAHAIAYQNTDAVLTHLPGNGSQDYMLGIIELNFEKRVGLFVDYCALRRNKIISCQ